MVRSVSRVCPEPVSAKSITKEISAELKQNGAVFPAGGGWGGDETGGGGDVMAQDSSVSMSRFEQRVHGADASVAELLLSSAA